MVLAHQVNVGLQPVQQVVESLAFRLQGLLGLLTLGDVTTEGHDLGGFSGRYNRRINFDRGDPPLRVNIINLQTSDITLLQALNHFRAISLTVIFGRPFNHSFAEDLL